MAFGKRWLSGCITALCLGGGGLGALISAPATAADFGEAPLPAERAIAVAVPLRNGELYNLTILERLNAQYACWDETGSAPTVITIRTVEFDANRHCDSKNDSNGYSLRVAGQDLGSSYRLSLSRDQDSLVLIAQPTRDPSVPPLEIGRTPGLAEGLLQIELNPGWAMAYRTYQNERLGHVYLTHAQPLDVPLAAANAPSLGASSSSPGPISPPTLPPVPPPVTPPPAPANNTYYRVIVPSASSTTLAAVRTIEPQAFTTTLNGQSVVQVGLFQEPQRAETIANQLTAAGLSPQVLPAAAPTTARPPVPAIPQGSVVVVIDPGHGGRDPGAIGIGGLQEKGINLTVSRRVQQQLEAAGLTVLMTRESDQWVDLGPRSDYANQVNADIFVSIHANAISMDRPEVNGLETYYYNSGQRLAQTIHSRVLAATDLGDRGVRQARFYVLRHTDMPAVLVETGFVTGSVDAARFRDPSAVNGIADAIAQGVLDYLGR